MAGVYFCQHDTENEGMLRAILNREDCQHLAAPGAITYLGDEFPNFAGGHRQDRDFAVLKVDAEEAGTKWRTRFYRVHAYLQELHSILLNPDHSIPYSICPSRFAP